MNLGYIFTFILTAFSTITTILPFLTQSSENNNPDIYRSQALYTLLNPRSSNPSKLSADLTLHTMLHYAHYTQVRDVRNQNANYHGSNDPEVLDKFPGLVIAHRAAMCEYVFKDIPPEKHALILHKILLKQAQWSN